MDTQIDRDKLPPGGIEGLLQLVERPVPDGIPDLEQLQGALEQLQDAEERDFEVTGLLGKSLTLSDRITAGLDALAGASFFKPPDGAEQLILHCAVGKIRIEKNPAGQLGRLTVVVRTSSWSKALELFVSGISPFLDFLSYQADTPVVMDKVQCRDIKNRVLVVNFVTPYADQIINPHVRGVREEMLPLYALYREAKINPSNFYKVLCYFKILDAVFKHLRGSLMHGAKAQGVHIQIRIEVVPDHPEFRRFDAQFCGKPVHDVYDGPLRKQYRNAVAHFLTENAQPLNVSDYKTRAAFADVVLLAQLCCRVVMDTQADYYQQFYAAGGRPDPSMGGSQGDRKQEAGAGRLTRRSRRRRKARRV